MMWKHCRFNQFYVFVHADMANVCVCTYVCVGVSVCVWCVYTQHAWIHNVLISLACSVFINSVRLTKLKEA